MGHNFCCTLFLLVPFEFHCTWPPGYWAVLTSSQMPNGASFSLVWSSPSCRGELESNTCGMPGGGQQGMIVLAIDWYLNTNTDFCSSDFPTITKINIFSIVMHSAMWNIAYVSCLFVVIKPPSSFGFENIFLGACLMSLCHYALQ